MGLKMEAACTLETLVATYKSVGRHSPGTTDGRLRKFKYKEIHRVKHRAQTDISTVVVLEGLVTSSRAFHSVTTLLSTDHELIPAGCKRP
jgi:hypothetical protein